MTTHRNDIISDWGIDENVPPSPTTSTHFQPLRYINGSLLLSAHSYTNSLNSNQSQLIDYQLENNTTDSTSFDSPLIDKNQYHDFIATDYLSNELNMINERYNEMNLLIVARRLLNEEQKLLKRVLDQFNYTIITCDMMRSDTKLVYLKTNELSKSPPSLFGNETFELMRYSIRLKRQDLRIISLLISMLRYLTKYSSYLFLKLFVSILIRYFVRVRVFSIQLYLNKMKKMMDKYMNLSFRFDNSIIGLMRQVRENKMKMLREEIAGQLLLGTNNNLETTHREISIQDYLTFKNGLTLLIITYNNNIKKLLPLIDISCLEKYLNIYKLDLFSKDTDFIWILNHSKFEDDEDRLKRFQIGQDFAKRQVQLEKLVKRYVFIRKIYLCCLLSMGELEDLSGNNNEIFYKQILENKFNLKIVKRYLGKIYKLGAIINSLKMERFLSDLNLQIKDITIGEKQELLLLLLQDEGYNLYDKLITRMDKIGNNLRYKRHNGCEFVHDKGIAQDLINLVKLYESTNRTVSNPVECATKRYSMPSIPKQRLGKIRDMVGSLTTNNNRCNNDNGNGNRRSSNSGLSFNLLTAVLEDGNSMNNHVVSFDDNYIKLGMQYEDKDQGVLVVDNNNSVVIHDMAQSTMIDIDNEIKTMQELRPEEEEEEEGYEPKLTHEEMRQQLNSTFEKLYK